MSNYLAIKELIADFIKEREVGGIASILAMVYSIVNEWEIQKRKGVRGDERTDSQAGQGEGNKEDDSV